jgi:hypothetical protein
MAPRGCRFRPGWPGRRVHTVLGVLRGGEPGGAMPSRRYMYKSTLNSEPN